MPCFFLPFRPVVAGDFALALAAARARSGRQARTARSESEASRHVPWKESESEAGASELLLSERAP